MTKDKRKGPFQTRARFIAARLLAAADAFDRGKIPADADVLTAVLIAHRDACKKLKEED